MPRAPKSPLRALPLLAATLLALATSAPATLAQAAKPPVESRWARHYRERLERFTRENAELDRTRRYLVFVGDSITEGFALGSHLRGLDTLNRGISADRIGNLSERGVLHRLEESVFACRPAVIFLMIGVNDLAASRRQPAVFVEGVKLIVSRIRARAPRLPIVLQTCLPAGRAYKRHAWLNPRIERFNDGLRALARERHLRLLDVYALYRGSDGLLPGDLTRDGLHLKREAYTRWAEEVRRLLGGKGRR